MSASVKSIHLSLIVVSPKFLLSDDNEHLVQVKLKDSIVSALRFFKTKETEIAWIDAMLDMSQARADIGEL